MGVQSFAVGNACRVLAQMFGCVGIEVDDTVDLDEIGDVERRAQAGCAAGGHGMAGSGYVVAEDFKRTLTI